MTRVVVHNHFAGRRIVGSMRATATVDHGHHHKDGEPCNCGGSCCTGLKPARRVADGYETKTLCVDVVYYKGGYGRSKTQEHRHYEIADVDIGPRAYAPDGAFVRAQLAKYPEHKQMRVNGWTPDNITGYWKK